MGGPDDGTGVVDTGEFDWDSVKDGEDIELWLIRVPNSVRLFFNPSIPLPPFFPHFPTGPTTGSDPALCSFQGVGAGAP